MCGEDEVPVLLWRPWQLMNLTRTFQILVDGDCIVKDQEWSDHCVAFALGRA
jgi:hypothetical protein